MQNYNAECRIRMHNPEFYCRMQNYNVELEQNRTECRIRTEQNRKQNEQIANRIQNYNRTEFSIEQQYEQNSKLDQNITENIPEFRITTEHNEKTTNRTRSEQNSAQKKLGQNNNMNRI